MLTGLGFGYNEEQGAYLRLHWVPFIQETLGQNSLTAGDELAVLDTTLGLGGKEDDFFLDRLDVIRVRKIKTSTFAIEDESPWSWQLRTGLAQDDAEKYDALFAFGIGKAWTISPQLTAYLMTDAAAHSIEPYLRLQPHAALLVGTGKLKGRLLAGMETSDYQGDTEPFLDAELQWSLSKQVSLFAGLEQRESEESNLSLELKWYW